MWDNVQGDQLLEVPLDQVFCFPAPEDPTVHLSKSVCVHLSLDVFSVFGSDFLVGEVIIVGNIEIFTATNGLAVIISCVISSASCHTIEPLGAICESGGPFATESRMILAGFLPADVTCKGDVVVGTSLQLANGEDLVVVVVKNNVPNRWVNLGVKDVIPVVVELDEGIVDDDWNVTFVSDNLVSIVIVVNQLIDIEGRSQRLVHELDTDNDVVVVGAGVLLGNLTQYGRGHLDVALGSLPVDFISEARIVETVLGAWDTVQVDPGLQVVLLAPA